MHQSIVTTAPPGPGNSRDFDFWSSQSQVKSPLCGDKRLLNSPLNAPAPRYIPISPLILGAKTKPPHLPRTAGPLGRLKHGTFPPLSPVLPRTRGVVVSIDWCITFSANKGRWGKSQWLQLTVALIIYSPPKSYGPNTYPVWNSNP